MWISSLIFGKVLRSLTRRTRTYLDNAIATAIDRPLIATILVVGFYIATFSLPLEPRVRAWLDAGFSTALGLVGIYAALSLLQELIKWYHLEIASKVESPLGHQLVGFVEWMLPVTAGIMAIILIIDSLGVKVTPVKDWLGTHGGRVGMIVLVTLIAIFVLDQAVPRLIARVVSKRATELDEEVKKRSDTLSRVLVTAGQGFLLFVSVIMLLAEFDINIAPVLTGVGVLGVAIGFGAQNVVRDVLAGLFIIMENQYGVGDVVKVADKSGMVEDINLRRTVLRDMDGAVHFVPNGEIKVTTNFTREWSRVNINITVDYSQDLDKVKEVLNQVGQEMAADPAWAPMILRPPHVLRVDNIAGGGIDIKVIGDTKPMKQWEVAGELRLRIKKAFDREGIEVPSPHTNVIIGGGPAGDGSPPAPAPGSTTP